MKTINSYILDLVHRKEKEVKELLKSSTNSKEKDIIKEAIKYYNNNYKNN